MSLMVSVIGGPAATDNRTPLSSTLMLPIVKVCVAGLALPRRANSTSANCQVPEMESAMLPPWGLLPTTVICPLGDDLVSPETDPLPPQGESLLDGSVQLMPARTMPQAPSGYPDTALG